MKKQTLIILFLLCHCSLIQNTKNQFGNVLIAFLSSAGFYSGEDRLPAPVDIVPAPTLTIPSNSVFSSIENSLKISKGSTETPILVQGKMVPIGDVYDIGLNFETFTGINPVEAKSVIFPEPITFEYKYDKSSLTEAGFIEEFTVYYFDVFSETWLPMDHVVIDLEKQTIQVATNHFTPFVLTALPTPTNTGVALAPQCLSTTMPITGEGGAQWTQLDAHFKYYKDRNYTITPTNDFYELGLNRSFGIATCNGGTPQTGSEPCGSFTEHKHNANLNYINFVADEDLTVYIMYDRRGASDASWLASESWTLDSRTIQTTDAVGSYKVYYKEFLKGNLVTLHGNRVGLPTNTAVDTNYWVAIKRKENNPGTCLASAENFQNPITHITAIPGQTSSTLLWKDIDLNSVSNLIIRRKKNAPPSSPADGLPVFGEEISTIGFKDTLLEENTTYYYSIFALNSEGVTSLAQTVLITTGVDSDQDGIRDSFESDLSCPAYSWFPVCTTNPNLADSDSDGINDLTEIIQQTNPNDPDTNPPNISSFTLLSETPTYFPIAKLSANATDNVPGQEIDWLITKSNVKPKFDHPGWQTGTVSPSLKEFSGIELKDLGNQNFYVWAKDKAGNISNLYAPVTINVLGFKYPKHLISVENNQIKMYKHNLLTNILEQKISKSIDPYFNIFQTFLSKDGKYFFLLSDVYNSDYEEFYLSVYRIDYVNDTITFSDKKSVIPLNFELSRNENYLIGTHSGYRVAKITFNKTNGTITNNSYTENLDPYDGNAGWLGFAIITKTHPKKDWVYAFHHYNRYHIVDLPSLNKLSSQSIGSTDLDGLQTLNFHPSGLFAYFLQSGELKVTDVDQITGQLYNFRNPINNSYSGPQKFIISEDGLILLRTENYGQSLGNYEIDPSNGNLTKKDTIAIGGNFRSVMIDSTSQFVYLKYSKVENNTTQIRTKIFKVDKTTRKLDQVGDQILGEDNHYQNQVVHSYDNTNPPVEVSLTQTNQLGFLQRDGVVKYPAPNTMLVGVIPNTTCGVLPPSSIYGDPCRLYTRTGQPLIDRSIGNSIQVSKTISDSAFIRCNKRESDFTETLSVKDSSDTAVNIQSFGDFWSKKLSFDFRPSDPNLSLNYSLTDHSSECLSTGSNVTNKSIAFTKKKISLKGGIVTTAGSPPPASYTMPNLRHYQMINGRALPVTSRLVTCIMERFDCPLGINLLNLFCNRNIITNGYYLSDDRNPKEFCASIAVSRDISTFSNPIYRFGYIKSLSFTEETRWIWENYQISDP
ncbi:hypothetical protein EHQ30_01710 [Leptospira brenneri]|uniref:Fibronectin type-III domain-containing protein n=1 Tax=Leptospira brenneri TaxID=2023182 RepID=A0A5F1Z717_9LEPT|nr:beta-propeller fold lactonase family protein [Leptospira brenneri]TGK95378.1 hypothetical protein EHQ30_01710 [Leptospira brenneri]